MRRLSIILLNALEHWLNKFNKTRYSYSSTNRITLEY